MIERRINAFGVGEPLVQTAKSGNEHRVIVELPGIKDIEQAKEKIKDAPLLEFKEEGEPDQSTKDMFDQINKQAKEKAQKVLEEVKNGGDFSQLAKDNSEDPGSKENGEILILQKRDNLFPNLTKCFLKRV